MDRLLAELEQDDDTELDDNVEDIDAAEECNHAARVAEEDEDNEDAYNMTGPRIIADVKLAKTIGILILQAMRLITYLSL